MNWRAWSTMDLFCIALALPVVIALSPMILFVAICAGVARGFELLGFGDSDGPGDFL